MTNPLHSYSKKMIKYYSFFSLTLDYNTPEIVAFSQLKDQLISNGLYSEKYPLGYEIGGGRRGFYNKIYYPVEMCEQRRSYLKLVLDFLTIRFLMWLQRKIMINNISNRIMINPFPDLTHSLDCSWPCKLWRWSRPEASALSKLA